MKREDLHRNVREKFLFEGPTSAGKTWVSMNITKLYAINGKTVLFIDPEDGTQRELDAGIYDDLTDEELDRITIIHANDVDTYLKWMHGWVEDKSIGTQINKIFCGTDGIDLKVCDGLMSEIEAYKARLTQKFIKNGYYVVKDKQVTINNPDLFTLPWELYAKLYDQLRESIVVMMSHRYDIIGTTHPFKATDAHIALQQSVYARFDSVVRLNKLELPSGNPMWNATIVKNRGKESPDKSNQLTSVYPIFSYFFKKFDMSKEEGFKKLNIEQGG